MSLGQSLQQRLLQKLSPQQIQLMKLLQVPTANLEERIKEELEENPALEVSEDGHDDSMTEEIKDEFDSGNEDDFDADGSEAEYENIDVSDYIKDGDDEVGDYKLRDDNYGDPDDQKTVPVKVETSFHEMLADQLGMLNLDDRSHKIAEQIIGSIDDDGYLRRESSSIKDDLAFRQNIDASEDEIDTLIKKIQHFDPSGICARNLQECLLLQLYRKLGEGKPVEKAIWVLEDYFEEFTKKHYEKIQRGLSIDDDGLKDIIQQIIKLNPKPGGNAGELNKAENYIIPDFFIFNNAGKLELTLNSRNAPDLRISEGYRDMLKDYDRGSKKDKRQKEAVLFIKQKIDAAKWFIDAIKQRQHTLTSVMGTIMDYQEEFFLTGDEISMRPMILKDIAERTNLDISTVSRVANSKFVQTEFGTYRLKFFFSESLSTDSGEEVSTREVKKILSDMVGDESKKKPLSDERLTELLQEKGYNIARRTVAKYREQLNIPVARLRKSYKEYSMQNGETANFPTANVIMEKNNQPVILRFFAQLVSFLFHPLFIPTYIAAYLFYVHPYAAAGLGEKLKLFRFFSVVFITAFLPAFSIFLMKQLGFIESIFLHTQKDRIIPYIVSMVFYWWAWHVAKNLHYNPAFIAMFLATFIGCIAGMMANIYFKISMHGIAVGALFVFFIWLAFSGTVTIGSYLAIATIITGLVCTARFIASDHNPVEVYAGLFTGMVCQLIAIGIAG